MKKNKTLLRLKVFIVVAVLSFGLCFLAYSIVSRVNSKLSTHNNETAKTLENQIPELDTLDPTVSKIFFVNQPGVDVYLVKDLIKSKLGEQYDSTKEGNLINVYFDTVNIFPKPYQFISKYSGANVKLRPNFDPYDRRYKTNKPTEGFTLNITIDFYRVDEEEIATLINKVIKCYLPRIYDRSFYFKEKKSSKSRKEQLALKTPDLSHQVRSFLISFIVSTYPHIDRCRG